MPRADGAGRADGAAGAGRLGGLAVAGLAVLLAGVACAATPSETASPPGAAVASPAPAVPSAGTGRSGSAEPTRAGPVAPAPATPRFSAVVGRVGAATAERMTGVSWRPGCPVPIADLRVVAMPHWGFDKRVHRGRLVVHRAVAAEVVGAFATLYDARFPIRRMRPVEAYGGSDAASMAADNTSAFNCRPVTGSPGRFSLHSYGTAIDINPVQNPYVDGGTVLPPAGRAYRDRDRVRPGMVLARGPVVRAFRRAGFTWGGSWQGLKDYQHVETDLR